MSTKVKLSVAIVLLQVALSPFSHAQGLVEAIGASSNEYFYDATATYDGGVVAVGSTASFGGTRILIVKFDPWGDRVWAKVVGESGCYSVARFVFETHNHYLVLGGETNCLASTTALTLMKFSSSGNRLWSKALLDSGDDFEYEAYDGIEDSDDDYVITGYVRRPSGREDLLLTAFDAAGEEVITKAWYGTWTPAYDHHGYAVIERDNGDYCVAGKMVSTTGESYALLFCATHWLVSLGGQWIGDSDENVVARSMVRTPDDGVAFTGVADGRLVVSRRDANLNPLWQKQMNTSSEGWSIIRADYDGDLIVAGEVGGDALLGEFTSGGCLWTSIGGGETDVGYTVVEGAQSYHPLWLGGTTWSWGIGLNDALLAKFDAGLHTCLTQAFHFGCVDWPPPEDSHAMSSALGLDYDVWSWSPQVIDNPGLTVTIVCDDECEEACCLDDGNCLELTWDDCWAANGIPQGAGTTCTEPRACFLPDGSCIMADPLCCDEMGGEVPNISPLFCGEIPQKPKPHIMPCIMPAPEPGEPVVVPSQDLPLPGLP